jgi:hypothetical protein
MLAFVDVANWFCSYWYVGLGSVVFCWAMQYAQDKGWY